MSNHYIVQRIMNNNIILAKHVKSGNEVVLMGKGIGFGRKKGTETTMNSGEIEKSFIAGNSSLKDSYMRMLEEVNSEIVELCTEIILVAEKKLGKLSDRSFIVIVDHISFAVEKLYKNIIIENPFSYEIAQLYPEEYAIGEYARKLILESIGIDVTEAEVGFVALHLNAARQHTVVSDTLKNTRIIKGMIEIVEFELDISFKDYSRLNNNLLLHLREFMQEVTENKYKTNHPLFGETVKQCRDAFEISKKLGRFVSKEKKLVVSDLELFYLTLHIDKLIRKVKNM